MSTHLQSANYSVPEIASSHRQHQSLRSMQDPKESNSAAILESFSRRAGSYDNNAWIQKEAARRLAEFIVAVTAHPAGEPTQDVTADLPDQLGCNSATSDPHLQESLLELGCGTGLFSQELIGLYPSSAITFSDLSSTMLELCMQRFDAVRERVAGELQFRVINAEQALDRNDYAKIFSSFTFQWLADFRSTIFRLVDSLTEDGGLFFSVPCSDSFQQWRQMAALAGVRCTCNNLIDEQHMEQFCRERNLSLTYEKYEIRSHFSSALHFFRSLKEIGATTSLRNTSLSLSDMNKLLQVWSSNCPEGVDITYSVINARIQRQR